MTGTRLKHIVRLYVRVNGITSRTLMRTPVVKRPTPPKSGFLPFCPRGWARRSRHPVTRSGLISVSWRRRYVSAPNTY